MNCYMNVLKTGVRSLLCVTFILLFSTKLFSQLSFYNTSTEDIYIAIRFVEKGVWKTQGWFKIGPLQAEEVLPKITSRYYYFHARSGDEKMMWSGTEAQGWVHKTNFSTTIEGKDYSGDSGYEQIGMKKLDVNTSITYTHRLDFRTKLVMELERYFSKPNLDPVEGMYSISDDITTETNGGAGTVFTMNEKRDHWAKVAIVKDTLSVSRNYIEFVLEAENFNEGEVRAEFLKTNQSSTIFMSEQRAKSKEATRPVVLEFNPGSGIIEGKFEYTAPRKKYTVTRSYLKYFPK